MMRRFRPHLALIALLALAASSVEQASATIACSGMDDPPAATVAGEGRSAHDHTQAAHTHAPSADQDSGSSERGEMPADPGSCPMTAAAGTACGIAALPSLIAGATLGVEVRRLAAPAADAQPGSLALASLFRPPRR